MTETVRKLLEEELQGRFKPRDETVFVGDGVGGGQRQVLSGRAGDGDKGPGFGVGKQRTLPGDNTARRVAVKIALKSQEIGRLCGGDA